MLHKTTQLSHNVLLVEIDAKKSGDRFSFLCRSDVHRDSKFANHKLETKHLEECLRTGSGILDHGDLFDAMGGKLDPRSLPIDIRDELKSGNYFDELVKYVSSPYEKYAKNFIMMSPGNHEKSVVRKHETCLTTRVSERISAKTGDKIPVQSYCGWVLFRFRIGTSGRVETIPYWYHHGSGVGRSPGAAKNKINYLDGPHIVYTGDKHNEWIEPLMKHGISTSSGRTYNYRQWFIRAPGYKNDFEPCEGYHIEKYAGGPNANGAIWLDFTIDSSGSRGDEKRSYVQTECRLAI